MVHVDPLCSLSGYSNELPESAPVQKKKKIVSGSIVLFPWKSVCEAAGLLPEENNPRISGLSLCNCPASSSVQRGPSANKEKKMLWKHLSEA